MDFVALSQACAPIVHQDTMRRIVAVESAFNPYAIGVVGGRLERQPKTHAEAVATARALQADGRNFSVGLAQVNQQHFERFGLTLETAFDACANLRAGSRILAECFERAKPKGEQPALRAAFSCYYSGNFLTGFAHGYVQKVVFANSESAPITPQVPRLESLASDSALTPARANNQNQSKRPIKSASMHSASEFTDPTSAVESKHRTALLF